jgi:hypothetical protein
MATKNIEKISNLYTNLTYFDDYSETIGIYVIITLATILVCVYCYVMIRAETIKKDWINQRCKPNIIPFAGLINKPDNMTATEYTVENFSYCTNDIMKSISKTTLSPFTQITNQMTNIATGFNESLNFFRELSSSMKDSLGGATNIISEKVKAAGAPLQTIFTIFKTILAKINGVLTVCMYSVLGMYSALKVLLNSIVDMSVGVLLTIAGIIIAFLVMSFIPFVGPLFAALAGAMTIGYAFCLALLVPLIKILTSATKAPSASLKACFDPSVEIVMNDGTTKRIVDIQVGDILSDSNVVTAKLKLSSVGSEMYNLNDVIVSHSHTVRHNRNWISVSDHPDAINIVEYSQPYIYCLNTSSKEIIINGQRFVDWDEIYTDDHMANLKTHAKLNGSIHTEMDSGFIGSAKIELHDGTIKEIRNIQIGDILRNGERVYGVVEIKADDLNQYKYNFGNNVFIDGGPNLTVCDPNISFITTLDIRETMKVLKRNQEDKLYHILTDKQKFTYNGVCFYDYNASIDLFLDNTRKNLLSMKYV